MRFLQIGLGSMGKRRIWCVKNLGYDDILALDLREDRRKEAEAKYNVKTIVDPNKIDFNSIDIIIVSTPPDHHDEYIALAIKQKKPVFVEASVILGKLEELNNRAKKEKIFVAPSCTLKFHPAIKDITNIVLSGDYGKLTNFTYHSGQYLPDWHPYEDMKTFYVSKKDTGAAREIVPFELTWIVGIAGIPKRVTGFNGKTMDMGVNIDDTYVIALEFDKKVYGVLNVDVVCRYATRSLILNMEYGQILWRWDENIIKLYDAKKQTWNNRCYRQSPAAEGYNKNITEDMYIEELSCFIESVKAENKFPNSLDEDIKLLKVLQKVERNNENT